MEQGAWSKRKIKRELEALRNKKKRSKEKGEKGARGKKLKGARSKGGNCERNKEHEPP